MENNDSTNKKRAKHAVYENKRTIKAVEYFAAGYHVFIVNYSVKEEAVNFLFLSQLEATVAHIRKHAGEWSIDGNKIAVCRFSAGGHLTASLGTLFNEDKFREIWNRTDNIRPDALILGIPSFCQMSMHIRDQELYQKEKDVRRQIAEIIYRRENPTVADYCEKWLTMQSAKVSAGTIKGYARSINKYIVKPLGGHARNNFKIVYRLDFHVTPHQLRHTYITNLLYAGVDPKTVQYLAGHENSKTTMDIYAKIKYNKPEDLLGVVNEALCKKAAN